MTYINLPRYIQDLLIPHDKLSELVPVIAGHAGLLYPTTTFMTTEGFDWVTNNGIQFKPSRVTFL
jgi:hypothetical protein